MFHFSLARPEVEPDLPARHQEDGRSGGLLCERRIPDAHQYVLSCDPACLPTVVDTDMLLSTLLDSTNLASPSPDALSDYDLSSTHLVVSAKDPHLNPAWHTRRGVYLLQRDKEGQVKTLTSGSQGATSSPRFSPDGKSVVWLEMEEDGYEADRNRIVLYDLASDKRHYLAKEWGKCHAPCACRRHTVEVHVRTDRPSLPLRFQTDLLAGSHGSTRPICS
jgi:dipeptidyl aminopeptidase/acylaminoacyl peptidase